jgi:hypothetical protein
MLPLLEGSQEYSCAPLEQTVLPLKCVNSGSKPHAEYHGEGLLLETLNTPVEVTMPMLFMKSGFWSLRGLPSAEILLANDLAKADIKKLTCPSKDAHFLSNL